MPVYVVLHDLISSAGSGWFYVSSGGYLRKNLFPSNGIRSVTLEDEKPTVPHHISVIPDLCCPKAAKQPHAMHCFFRMKIQNIFISRNIVLPGLPRKGAIMGPEGLSSP
jgi:hypothetical protein